MLKIYKNVDYLTLKNIRLEIKHCAEAASYFHKCNAFPLVMFVFSNAIDALVWICRIGTTSLKISAVYFISLFIYQLYIAHLSIQTQNLFKLIMQRKKTIIEQKVNLKLRQSNFTQLNQLAFYKTNFNSTVFDIFYFNYIYLFNLVLFILNYSVFILQTKSN